MTDDNIPCVVCKEPLERGKLAVMVGMTPKIGVYPNKFGYAHMEHFQTTGEINGDTGGSDQAPGGE